MTPRLIPAVGGEAFEKAGALDLAIKIDETLMVQALALHGATYGHVRAAKRAAALDDRTGRLVVPKELCEKGLVIG